MSIGLQQWIVGVLVVMAALFTAWRLATSSLKVKMLDTLLRLVPASTGGAPGTLRAAMLRRRAAATASGCAACSSGPKSTVDPRR